MSNQNQDLPAYLSDDDQMDDQQQDLNDYNTAQPYSSIHATTFKDLMLSDELMRSINEAGFENPSAVQQQCIQNAIQRKDLLCQAKSGMGKTAVFVLAILQNLKADSKPVSALVLCHSRELAYQIQQEFQRLGKYQPEIKSRVIYGGEPIEDQKRALLDKNTSNIPKIIVGTPGRVLDLVERKILNLENVQYFVLDECDKMLDQIDMRRQVQDIFTKTPFKKQVMMYSATMNDEVRTLCRKFMEKPVEIAIDDDQKLTLDGLQQYYLNIAEEDKTKKLIELLDALNLNLAIVFVKSIKRAIALDKILQDQKFPSTSMHSKLAQDERIARFNDFKNYKKRVLVSTDLFGRGIDIARVNIVINYDMPTDQEDQQVVSSKKQLTDSYLHRVGRAGRFGTKGLAISFVSTQQDKDLLNEIQSRFVVKINELPDEIDTSQYMNN